MTLLAGYPLTMESGVDNTDGSPPLGSSETRGTGIDATFGDSTAQKRAGLRSFRLTMPGGTGTDNRKIWNFPGAAHYHGQRFWSGFSIYVGEGFDNETYLIDNGSYFLASSHTSFRADVPNGPGCALTMGNNPNDGGRPWLRSRRENRNGQVFGTSTDDDNIWIVRIADLVGKWTDFVFDVQWGKSGASGGHHRRFWVNGVKKGESLRPTLPNDWDTAKAIRYRWGIYQGDNVPAAIKRTLYIDEVRISAPNTGSYAEVDPAQGAVTEPTTTPTSGTVLWKPDLQSLAIGADSLSILGSEENTGGGTVKVVDVGSGVRAMESRIPANFSGTQRAEILTSAGIFTEGMERWFQIDMRIPQLGTRQWGPLWGQNRRSGFGNGPISWIAKDGRLYLTGASDFISDAYSYIDLGPIPTTDFARFVVGVKFTQDETLNGGWVEAYRDGSLLGRVQPWHSKDTSSDGPGTTGGTLDNDGKANWKIGAYQGGPASVDTIIQQKEMAVGDSKGVFIGTTPTVLTPLEELVENFDPSPGTNGAFYSIRTGSVTISGGSAHLAVSGGVNHSELKTLQKYDGDGRGVVYGGLSFPEFAADSPDGEIQTYFTFNFPPSAGGANRAIFRRRISKAGTTITRFLDINIRENGVLSQASYPLQGTDAVSIGTGITHVKCVLQGDGKTFEVQFSSDEGATYKTLGKNAFTSFSFKDLACDSAIGKIISFGTPSVTGFSVGSAIATTNLSSGGGVSSGNPNDVARRFAGVGGTDATLWDGSVAFTQEPAADTWTYWAVVRRRKDDAVQQIMGLSRTAFDYGFFLRAYPSTDTSRPNQLTVEDISSGGLGAAAVTIPVNEWVLVVGQYRRSDGMITVRRCRLVKDKPEWAHGEDVGKVAFKSYDPALVTNAPPGSHIDSRWAVGNGRDGGSAGYFGGDIAAAGVINRYLTRSEAESMVSSSGLVIRELVDALRTSPTSDEHFWEFDQAALTTTVSDRWSDSHQTRRHGSSVLTEVDLIPYGISGGTVAPPPAPTSTISPPTNARLTNVRSEAGVSKGTLRWDPNQQTILNPQGYAIYASPNGDTEWARIATTPRRHMRGISVAGGEFGTPGPVAATSTFSNANPGTENSQYTYPKKADLQYLYDQGFREIRLPLRLERYFLPDGTVRASEFARLAKTASTQPNGVLDDAHEVGMRVIPEWHNYGAYYVFDGTQGVRRMIGSTEFPRATFALMIRRTAELVAKHPAFFGLGLMNEPIDPARTDQAGHLAAALLWEGDSEAARVEYRAVTRKLGIVGGYHYNTFHRIATYHPDKWLADHYNMMIDGHYYPDRDNSGQFVNSYDAELENAATRLLNFRGDYETGDFLQWSEVQAPTNRQPTIVTDIVRQGRYAARFELQPNDTSPLGTTDHRSEVFKSGTGFKFTEGMTRWFGFSLRPDHPDFADPTKWGNGNQMFLQWKNDGTGSAPIDVRILEDGRLALCDRRVYNFNTGLKIYAVFGRMDAPGMNGAWHDFEVGVHFSVDGTIGWIEVYYQGVRHKMEAPRRSPAEFTLSADGYRVITQTLQPDDAGTTVNESASYIKQGYYTGADMLYAGVIYHDRMRYGATRRAVASGQPYGDKDLLHTRCLGELQPGIDWKTANGVEVVIGEIGAPSANARPVAEAAQWADLLTVLYARIDSADMSVLHWTTGRWWNANNENLAISSSGGASGVLDTIQSAGLVLKNSLPTAATEALDVQGALGTPKFFAVSARDHATTPNESDLSNTVALVPDDSPPTPPKNLRLLSKAGGSFQLDWDSNTGLNLHPAPYILERKVNAGGEWTEIAALADSTYTDADTVGTATYFYRVRARNTVDVRSEPSNEAIADLRAAPPAGFRIVEGPGQILVDWSNSEEPNVTSYRLYRRTGEEGNFVLIYTGTDSQFLDTGLVDGETYYYYATAISVY